MSKISPLAPAPGKVRHPAKKYRTQIASGAASVSSHFIAYPLFTVMRRMQTFDNEFIKCATRVYRDEGLLGFYRGMWQPLFSITACRLVTFSVYQQMKYRTSAFIGKVTGGPEPLLVVNEPGTLPNLGTITCFGVAAAIAGAATSLIGTPFELITSTIVLAPRVASEGASSSSAQVVERAASYQNKKNIQVARTIVKNMGGLQGLYTGWRMQCLRDMIGTATYFVTYETSKQWLVKYQNADSPVSAHVVPVAGAIGGVTSMFIYPLDRAKSDYQRKKLTAGPGVKVPLPKIEWFVRQSWNGFSVAIARSALQHSMVFSIFEYVKKRINRLPDPDAP